MTDDRPRAGYGRRLAWIALAMWGPYLALLVVDPHLSSDSQCRETLLRMLPGAPMVLLTEVVGRQLEIGDSSTRLLAVALPSSLAVLGLFAWLAGFGRCVGVLLGVSALTGSSVLAFALAAVLRA